MKICARDVALHKEPIKMEHTLDESSVEAETSHARAKPSRGYWSYPYISANVRANDCI